MKLGLAFSGSGAGALSSHILAQWLRDNALEIEMLSACSLAAIPAMLWSRGISREETGELIEAFSRSATPVQGVGLLDRMGVFRQKPVCELAVSSVDVPTGVTVIYSDLLHSDAWNLKVLPLSGNEREGLCATLCPWRGSDPYPARGMQLCDFSVRYGCPFFPLKMAGMERLLSFSFAGGELPAQIAADALISLTGKNADLHCTIADAESIEPFLQARLEELYQMWLF